MNDEQIILCAALCGLAAFIGFKYGQRAQQLASAAQSQADPLDSTGWLAAGGWRA